MEENHKENKSGEGEENKIEEENNNYGNNKNNNNGNGSKGNNRPMGRPASKATRILKQMKHLSLRNPKTKELEGEEKEERDENSLSKIEEEKMKINTELNSIQSSDISEDKKEKKIATLEAKKKKLDEKISEKSRNEENVSSPLSNSSPSPNSSSLPLKRNSMPEVSNSNSNSLLPLPPSQTSNELKGNPKEESETSPKSKEKKPFSFKKPLMDFYAKAKRFGKSSTSSKSEKSPSNPSEKSPLSPKSHSSEPSLLSSSSPPSSTSLPPPSNPNPSSSTPPTSTEVVSNSTENQGEKAKEENEIQVEIVPQPSSLSTPVSPLTQEKKLDDKKRHESEPNGSFLMEKSRRSSKSSKSSSPFGSVTKSIKTPSNSSSPIATSKFLSLRGQKSKGANNEEEDLAKLFSLKFGNGGTTIGRKQASNNSKFGSVDARALSAFMQMSPPNSIPDFDQLPAGKDRSNSSFGFEKIDADELLKSLGGGNSMNGSLKQSQDIDEPDKYGTVNARRVNITSFFSSPNPPSAISSPSSILPSSALLTEDRSLSVQIPVGVVTEFAVKSELNAQGLKRGKKEKKEFITPEGKKKSAYQNEDEYSCLCPFEEDNSQGFFGVYDGHVDKNAAQAAKKLLPERFLKKIRGESKPFGDLKEIMHNTFVEVDQEMSAFEYEGCTSTIVFAWTELNGDRFIQAANVGDSSAIICRGGNFIPLSFDHKVKDNEEEHKRLKAMGIEMHEHQSRLHGLAICRTLGDHCLKKGNEKTGIIADPFVSPVIRIESGDILVLASDGLWDVVTFQKAAEMVKDLTNTTEMVRRLMNIALGHSECKDNVTVICSVLA